MRRWFVIPALVCLAFMGLVAPLAPVQAASPDATDPATTVLYPGWNFVGWLGADGSVDDLFDQVAAVEAVSALAPGHPAAAMGPWEPVARGAGRMIRTGEPLWIRLAGEHGQLWRQAALRAPPVMPLGAGQHAVVWAWGGDRPFGAVLGRVAGQMVSAQRWNRFTQAFEQYAPDGNPFSIARGEALYLRLDAPAVWGPAEGPTITGAEWLPQTDRRTLEETVAGVHAYFERWLGITPQPFALRAQEFPFPCLTSSDTFRATIYLPCLEIALDQLAGATMAESYATAAVSMARERAGHTEPEWLVAGQAHYVYARWMAAAGLRPYWSFYSEMIGYTRATDFTLDSAPLQARLSANAPRWVIIDPARPLWEPSRRQFERWMGALAVDWLVQWTGEAALQQYAQTRFAGDWRAAFQDAFGMSIDQFLSWFEHYRPGVTAADGGAPRLRRPFHSVVFAGPLTDERRALVPAIEAFVDFFEREYGLSATAATFVLDINEASYKDILAGGLESCGYANGSLIYVRAGCAFPFIIAHEFAHVLQKELAVGGEWPQLQWLVEGSAEYLAMQQWLDAGPADPETAWASREAFAAGMITGLPATASDAAVARAALERDELYQVYALAVRHLVARFGIEPLFAAFGPTWRDAGPDEASRFQAVFGASLDDFHASFGRWLRSLPAPPPAEPDPDGGQVCPVAWADAQGVFQVALDGPGPNCTVLRSGGHVAVSRGDSVRTFTLYRGYGWLIIDQTHVFGTAAAAFLVVDPSGAPRSGEITLALGDGRELARRVPPELADLHAVFDAITSSPGG